MGIGLALAVVGWGVGTQIETVSDIRSLAPQSLPAVRDLNELQDATGVSGELDVSVQAPDLTDPATIRWMAAFKQRVLRANGFSGADPSCLQRRSLPRPGALGFPHRRRRQADPSGDSTRPSRQLSAYDLAQVAPVDPRTGRLGHTALLTFGIRAQSLEDQQALIERVRGEIGAPGSPGGPPRRGRGAARRAAGDRRRGGHRPLHQPLLADPGRPARRRAGAARRLPLASAGPGPADSDRAGDRLVVAGPLAQPASRSTRCRRRWGR